MGQQVMFVGPGLRKILQALNKKTAPLLLIKAQSETAKEEGK